MCRSCTAPHNGKLGSKCSICRMIYLLSSRCENSFAVVDISLFVYFSPLKSQKDKTIDIRTHYYHHSGRQYNHHFYSHVTIVR